MAPAIIKKLSSLHCNENLAFAENKIECHAGIFNIRVKTESQIENVSPN